MIRLIAILLGIGFLVAGVLGFVPEYTPENHLFGYFHVNPAHNLIHIVTGLIALWTGFAGTCAAKIFFKIFGFIYLIVAFLGLYFQDRDIFGMVANNTSDVALHFAVGIIAILLGFGCTCKDRC